MTRTEWPCLRLTQTRTWAQPELKERLPDYGALAAWGERFAGLAAAETARLVARAEAAPAEAERVLVYARELRLLLWRIFSAIAADEAPEQEDLDRLSREVAAVGAERTLVLADDAFVWQWRAPGDCLDAMLWPAIASAAELLTSDEVARVRECAADDCGWLFIDASRNRSRRWCDMSECGNRAKVRRYRERTRSDG